MGFTDLLSFQSYLQHGGWILQIVFVLFITIFIKAVQKRIVTKLIVRLASTKTYWEHALLVALQKPLGFLVWFLSITLIADIISEESSFTIFAVVEPVRTVGVIISIAWFLIRFVGFAEVAMVKEKQIRGQHLDQTTLDAITKLLRVSIMIISVLVILQTLGYSISGVLAFGGIGGIAVGFAARDVLANLFGGLAIYLDRPFEIGDWIRSPDREIEGTVEQIGWRLTTIRTFDKRPLYIPNAVFSTIAVENPTRMTNRRIKETIGIRYCDANKIREVVTAVKTMLKQHDDIDAEQTLIVNFNEFAPSSLNFFIYTFTKTVNWIEYHEVKQDVMLNVIDIIEANGAECAFPTSTIEVPNEIHISSSIKREGIDQEPRL